MEQSCLAAGHSYVVDTMGIGDTLFFAIWSSLALLLGPVALITPYSTLALLMGIIVNLIPCSLSISEIIIPVLQLVLVDVNTLLFSSQTVALVLEKITTTLCSFALFWRRPAHVFDSF